MPATAGCPRTHAEVFISGTEPVGTCPLHGGGRTAVANVTGWDTTPATARDPLLPGDNAVTVSGTGGDGRVNPSPASRRAARQAPPAATPPDATPPAKKDDRTEEKKKNILPRILGVFK